MNNPNEKVYESVYNQGSSDMSCSARADRMSCSAMTDLAIKEAKNNRVIQQYSTDHPVCERFTELADRLKEDVLQKGEGLTRMMCFKAEGGAYRKDGDWVNQFSVAHPVPGIYLMSTKQRFRSKA